MLNLEWEERVGAPADLRNGAASLGSSVYPRKTTVWGRGRRT
jgi:hypothetical protein